MASNIDPSNIDENFPIAGEDNDTQGFRDNFAFIKNALETAKTEISSLELSQPQTLLDLGIVDGQEGFVLKANGNGTFEFRDPGEDGIVGVLTDLTDVTITTPADNQILKYDGATNQWINGTNPASLENLTTDDLPEGNTNFYLTVNRFQEYFEDSYSAVTGDLLSSNFLDSTEILGTRVQSGFSKILQISNIEFINRFNVGDKVRIFRASENETYLSLSGNLSSVTKVGFTAPIADPYTFSYKICQFNRTTGKISPAGPEVSISDIDITNFNLVNNITLAITRTSQENGVLIYRKITGTSSTATFNLIAVLGEKEFEGTLAFPYVDYFDFDLTVWSKKDLVRNEFTAATGIVHAPLTAPVSPTYGWVDATIESVDTVISRITLTQNFYFESNVIISNDDTAFLQSEINSKASAGINNLVLGPKTYIVSRLTLPSGFTLVGKGTKTKLKKLSWSSHISNNILLANNSTQVSISNFSIDGNMQNQYLLNDETTPSSNYIINITGNKHEFNYLTIDNVIGGGIYCEGSSEAFISLSRISNSGLTDVYEYSPIQARSSEEITISNNFMKNFPGPLDVSVSNIGVLNANTVNNCGSGILTFGATKFITSPNLVLGPAEEFIPGPDIFNSQYDSVNIKIEKDTNFLSDNYVYQENGVLFDLTANRSSIEYKINKLRLVANVEEVGDEILINGSKPINPVSGTDLENGNFRFAIAAASVNVLKTTYSYSNEKLADPNHVGLIYRVLLTEYVPSGTVLTITNISPKIISSVGVFYYEVVVDNITNLAVGSRIKFLNHGGTPDLNSVVGTIVSINNYQNNSKTVRIEYPQAVTAVGNGGFITLENTFILAKGTIL